MELGLETISKINTPEVRSTMYIVEDEWYTGISTPHWHNDLILLLWVIEIIPSRDIRKPITSISIYFTKQIYAKALLLTHTILVLFFKESKSY